MGKGKKGIVKTGLNFATGGAYGIAEGVLGGFGAAGDMADAAGNAARAQQRAAQAAYNETASIVNPATVAGLASLDRDIANQEKNLSRQEQLIQNIDPTIIEASQQALKLLRGEQSSTLNPIRNQRDMQRQKLMNNLRRQLGPGAETSTAGIQALTRFDAETDSLMSGAQQQALANMGGLATQFNSTRPDMYREIMGLSGLGQAKTGLRFQQAAALGNARLGLQQTAGAEYAGDMMRAQNKMAQTNQLIGLGTSLLGASMGAPSAGGKFFPNAGGSGQVVGGGTYGNYGNIA